ncbi:RICIN domain-containing protein [Kutzneria sp. CA-103260]|uniref:RICIN domain-containing protein n=1 Tax=Kutzneria sp. CA-103260 TaxID=2802641 RepID=UPI0020117669|nr:RICIN domain-containing protein [Kutzneria sp. CA-103260]
MFAAGAGKCLDVPASPDRQLRIYPCDGRVTQSWTHTSSGQFTIKLDGVPLCVDVYGRGTRPGTKVVAWPCNGQTNQQWIRHPDGTITGVESGLCLDVTDRSVADGALAEVWTCNGGSNQQWMLK